MIDKAYFDTLAQVLPILLIITVIEGRLGRLGLSINAWWAVPAATLAVIVGEAACLRALAEPSPGRGWFLLATWGLCVAASALGLELAVRLDIKRPVPRPEPGKSWLWLRKHVDLGVVTLTTAAVTMLPLVIGLWVTVATLV